MSDAERFIAKSIERIERRLNNQFSSESESNESESDHDTESFALASKMYRPIVVPPPPRNILSNIKQDLFVTLIPTVIILVKNAFEELIKCRALLDTGSAVNFISEEFFRNLSIEPSSSDNFLSQKTKITIKSRYSEEFSKEITCQRVPQIDSQYPQRNIDRRNFKEVESYFLADPNFNVASKIDLILGNDIAFSCLLNKKHSLPNGALLSETKFGWVVGGAVTDIYPPN